MIAKYRTEYICMVCAEHYMICDDIIENIDLAHENGELLSITIVHCPHCESVSLPENMNQISWIVRDDDEY